MSQKAKDQMKFGVNHMEHKPATVEELTFAELDAELETGATSLILTTKEFMAFWRMIPQQQRERALNDGLNKTGDRYHLDYQGFPVYCAGFSVPQSLLGLRLP